MAGALISVDMEGVAGVVHGDHTRRDGVDYGLARALMTAEANAAIEGALASGADQVVVNDAHGTMRNLLPAELHQKADVVTGSPKPLVMMEGVDVPGVAAVMCVGYHARAGTRGVLDHTINSRVVREVRINGEPASEFDLSAGIAGAYNIPVVMIAGDDVAVAQAKERVPGIEVAMVKRAIHRTAARHLSPEAACMLIKIAARNGFQRRELIEPFTYPSPVTVSVTWQSSGMTDAVAFMPRVERVNAVTSEYRCDDFLEAFQALTAMVMLAGTVR